MAWLMRVQYLYIPSNLEDDALLGEVGVSLDLGLKGLDPGIVGGHAAFKELLLGGEPVWE